MTLFNVNQIFHKYCQGCPDMEIEMIEPEKYYAGGNVYFGSDCTITCSHYDLCHRLRESIKDK